MDREDLLLCFFCLFFKENSLQIIHMSILPLLFIHFKVIFIWLVNNLCCQSKCCVLCWFIIKKEAQWILVNLKHSPLMKIQSVTFSSLSAATHTTPLYNLLFHNTNQNCAFVFFIFFSLLLLLFGNQCGGGEVKEMWNQDDRENRGHSVKCHGCCNDKVKGDDCVTVFLCQSL